MKAPDRNPTWSASMVAKPYAPVFEMLATQGNQDRHYPYMYPVLPSKPHLDAQRVLAPIGSIQGSTNPVQGRLVAVLSHEFINSAARDRLRVGLRGVTGRSSQGGAGQEE